MGYDWKDRIREKMSGYTEVEPEGLLQGIMKELDSSPDILKQSGRRHSSDRKPFFRIAGIVSAVAASVALLAILWKDGTQGNESSIAVIHDKIQIEADETPKLPELMAEASPKNATDTEIANKENIVIIKTKVPEKTVTYEGKTVPDEGKPDRASGKNPVKESKSSIPEQSSDTKYGNSTLKDEWEYDFPEEKETKKQKSFSADIFYSNLASSNTRMAGYSTMRLLGSTPFSGIPDRASVSATPGEGVMLLTSGAHSSTTVKHRQPVRVGATFRYKFTKCWGIETGLVYSFLSSRMETTESQYKSITEQKLHYIGIPLKVNWSFLNREHFALYLNAGGMLEKCVAGNALTDYTINEKGVSRDKYNISAKPVQWSASAAAGVQWNITNLIGIYAEPGISYHFNDGSPISTAYKEKPLNFNLEIGLRFSFE